MYTVVSSIIFLVATVMAVAALWLIIRKSWLMSWIKATLALCVVGIGVFLILTGFDLIQFRSFQVDVPVAKVSLKQLRDQQFRLLLDMPDRQTQEFRISGDMWQLDARLLTWEGPFASIGMRPGYRFERISGRYLLLEQEQSAERSVYAVEHMDTGLDTWSWLLEHDQVPWVKARYGSAAYLPMRDGAEFSVAIGVDGLIAKPLNTPAVEAIERWQ